MCISWDKGTVQNCDGSKIESSRERLANWVKSYIHAIPIARGRLYPISSHRTKCICVPCLEHGFSDDMCPHSNWNPKRNGFCNFGQLLLSIANCQLVSFVFTDETLLVEFSANWYLTSNMKKSRAALLIFLQFPNWIHFWLGCVGPSGQVRAHRWFVSLLDVKSMRDRPTFRTKSVTKTHPSSHSWTGDRDAKPVRIRRQSRKIQLNTILCRCFIPSNL